MGDHLRALDPQSHTWVELAELQRLVLDAFPGIVMVLDMGGRIRRINAAGAQRLGVDPAELVDRPLVGSLIPQEDVQARAAQLSQAGDDTLPADFSVVCAPVRHDDGRESWHAWGLRGKDGAPMPTALAVGSLRDHRGEVTGWLAVQAPAEPDEDALPAFAHHDRLTGLPARSVLPDRVEMAIQRAARQKSVLALMLVEVVDFTALCEQYGHSVGDDVLRATAGRLNFELRKTDTAVRLDGGQFAAMLVDLHQADEARLVAGKVQRSVSRPVNVGVAVIPVRARVGVAWFPDHGDQLLSLLQAAEAALDQATDGAEGEPGVAQATEHGHDHGLSRPPERATREARPRG